MSDFLDPSTPSHISIILVLLPRLLAYAIPTTTYAPNDNFFNMPPFPFPAEITIRVFALSLPEDDEPFNLARTRMSLVRVCRVWREIATGTPQLWTNISLPFVYVGRRALRLKPSTLYTWLLWSSRQPLTISLAVPPYDSAQLEEAYVQVITAFCGYWKNVTLLLTHGQAMEALCVHFDRALKLNNYHNVLPKLSQFVFDLRGGFGATNPYVHRDSRSVPVYDALSRSSNLQTLSVANWGALDTTTRPSLAPLTFAPTLRALKIVHDYHEMPQALLGYDLGGLLGLVGGCERLESLTLAFSNVNFVGHSVLPLPKLKSLRILAADVDTLAALASSFHVPNLTTLSLGIESREHEEGAADILGPHFLRLLQDCAHTLQDLTLHVAGLFEEDANKRALASLPVLSSLVVGHIYFLDEWAEIFRLLKFDFNNRKPTFPEQNLVLQRLVFELDVVDPIPADAYPEDIEDFLTSLADMVLSRRAEAIPRNAISIVRKPIRPLSVVGMGRTLVGLYTRSEPYAAMPVVGKAWRSLKSFVDCKLYDSLEWQE
ncbi:uncharacterized protein STEHIDRAFT_156089 [Stereum hirsutum FP-91666 SS1]|uniref:uncharacterized protein n=1 Tax=Stereum hirsutum (strain FP-91666) TaxID=721885 RepID=UPI000440DF4A|nr:uncharacterized protein STEHIDRAFT_156089 [Stereum hirsutum FP-91666 SS1]EIM87099.1 hypothetical protein STEHIDRAFT_156089 [Stereum hirsutum FP-91666 SS1]